MPEDRHNRTRIDDKDNRQGKGRAQYPFRQGLEQTAEQSVLSARMNVGNDRGKYLIYRAQENGLVSDQRGDNCVNPDVMWPLCIRRERPDPSAP